MRQPEIPALRITLISAFSVELLPLDRIRDIAYERCFLVRLSAMGFRPCFRLRQLCR